MHHKCASTKCRIKHKMCCGSANSNYKREGHNRHVFYKSLLLHVIQIEYLKLKRLRQIFKAS